VPLGNGVFLKRERERGAPLKSFYFTAIGLSSVKTVAHKHRHTAVITSTNDNFLRVFALLILNDLEPPKSEVLLIFFAISGCDIHSKIELRRNSW